MHFGEVLTGLYFTAKSILQKIKVLTGVYLAAYQFTYKFLTKMPTTIRTKFEKTVSQLLESEINLNSEYLAQKVLSSKTRASHPFRRNFGGNSAEIPAKIRRIF